MTRNEGRRLLRRFLGRCYHAKIRRETLAERLDTLTTVLQIREKSGQGGLDEVKASIEAVAIDIRDQILLELSTIQQANQIISLLPQDSAERLILELRYINCKSWSEIRRTVHRSRTGCYGYYCRGLDALLEKQQVQDALEEFTHSMEKDGVFSAGKKSAFPEGQG